ncbi:methyl jasmonate esterase 1-like [Ziziphus jujuba]|uniref:Methyl jasmonate esterase 1-like n=1 Tax=Ziziphus jujuba TaxID=326968 RepID=A0A6P4A8N1_ZIZJJ|nr:methyl jasmonate esterase 1-like [Ziziphus jujuba]XP_060675022.1 methyl jasmonate esterase 1-like [Ziziphus jujuba]
MKREKHFLLVHGACHGAWCWFKISSLLKSMGHKVTALDMAASGIHPKQVLEVHSFSDCVEPLIEFMASLPPEERVILVGHSMGGAWMSAAMERFPERISVSVYAAALMPGPDFSFLTLTREFLGRVDSFMDSQYTFDNGPKNPPTTILFGPNFLASKFYQLSPPEDLVLALSLVRPLRFLTPEEISSSKEAQLTKEKHGLVPRVYILCEQDNINTPDFQRWMIENNPPDQVKVISGSDHMAMFSKPIELCSYLQEIAEQYS